MIPWKNPPITTSVGDPSIRLEYPLVGSAIDQCAVAKYQAPKGTVVVSDELLPFADAHDPQQLRINIALSTPRAPISTIGNTTGC